MFTLFYIWFITFIFIDEQTFAFVPKSTVLSRLNSVKNNFQVRKPSIKYLWGFPKDDSGEENSNKQLNDKSNNQKEDNYDDQSSSLISLFGENSPTVSPLLILPTNRRPVFPGYLSAVYLKNPTLIEAITNGKSNEPNYVGLFLRKDPKSSQDASSDLITDPAELNKVGTFAQIQNVIKSDMGAQVILLGHRRITLEEVQSMGPPTFANVQHWKKSKLQQTNTLKALTNEVLALARELIRMSPLLREQIQLHQWAAGIDLNDPYRLADFATALITADGADLQRVLETENIEERLRFVLELLAKEKELAKIQKEITKQVEDKLNKQQREYFLKEQLKSIKKELGLEGDDKEELLLKYTQSLNKLVSQNVSEDLIRVAKDEIKKIESMEKHSPDYNLIRSYLDFLFALPWAKFSDDSMNLKSAKLILDEDHFGLIEIKKRILEFIAVGKLKGSMNGKILCFIGPPGVGKTSIAKSIARALNKKFFRFSVGGLTDTAEIKGHRRTYVGALPGKPIQSLKNMGVMNPLILIDEIDKLGRGYTGDPASALLELLDPNQNSNFVDHYLDVPIDFSKALFVCTANDESTIPEPLRDRMEIIRLTGYDIPEKVAIASRYLVPKALKESGLVNENQKFDIHEAFETPDNFVPRYNFTEQALETLIKNYCRESGVRSLEKMIEKIVSKIAFTKVEKDDELILANSTEPFIFNSSHYTVQPEDIEKFVGKPFFSEENLYDSSDSSPLPPGIVMGLAWNPLGGSPIFIETVATPAAVTERDMGVHMITGQLGDVMKESVNIAYTFARKFTQEKDKSNKFFQSHQVHLHVPEGAISKDGPSAGVALASSFIRFILFCRININY